METLCLHLEHAARGARFDQVNGAEVVADYGDAQAEYGALRQTGVVLDLSFRSRLCVTGADRVRFLHGQVTNDVQRLKMGEGCYAALITAKGRIQSDLNIYRLEEELLLDFEPGLTPAVCRRLEQYIIAEDVQVVDVAPHYGLLSVQGPKAREIVSALAPRSDIPQQPWRLIKVHDAGLGEVYIIHQPRLRLEGYDCFVPVASLAAAFEKMVGAAAGVDGRVCGWNAFELARIEAGVPRFVVDMDETNIPLEAGLEGVAISFQKGCYIGQEVISRIKTYGQVAKALRGLQLAEGLKNLPAKGDKLFRAGKEAGYVTSAAASPEFGSIALGYVRREMNEVGTELQLRQAEGERAARIVEVPFSGRME